MWPIYSAAPPAPFSPCRPFCLLSSCFPLSCGHRRLTLSYPVSKASGLGVPWLSRVLSNLKDSPEARLGPPHFNSHNARHLTWYRWTHPRQWGLLFCARQGETAAGGSGDLVWGSLEAGFEEVYVKGQSSPASRRRACTLPLSRWAYKPGKVQRWESRVLRERACLNSPSRWHKQTSHNPEVKSRLEWHETLWQNECALSRLLRRCPRRIRDFPYKCGTQSVACRNAFLLKATAI